MGIYHDLPIIISYTISYNAINIYWLVVFRHPSEEYEFVRLDHHPNYWGKSKMFQTTIWVINHYEPLLTTINHH